ncbi:uncharacterized protein LOC142350565 [Convolutriloba macropyga]|uniref:uncharacterized protein LOC142350565 n=1 Tax=Convolutriloba macropyga TaxID=536237 RepID=UPI003F5238CE
MMNFLQQFRRALSILLLINSCWPPIAAQIKRDETTKAKQLEELKSEIEKLAEQKDDFGTRTELDNGIGILVDTPSQLHGEEYYGSCCSRPFYISWGLGIA